MQPAVTATQALEPCVCVCEVWSLPASLCVHIHATGVLAANCSEAYNAELWTERISK